jgi:hypothetical protein
VWWQEIYQRFVIRPRTFLRVQPQASRRRGLRFNLEQLEDRLVPSATWVEQGPGIITGAEPPAQNAATGEVEAIAVDPSIRTGQGRPGSNWN